MYILYLLKPVGFSSRLCSNTELYTKAEGGSKIGKCYVQNILAALATGTVFGSPKQIFYTACIRQMIVTDWINLCICYFIKIVQNIQFIILEKMQF
jgi:hypothetical protein